MTLTRDTKELEYDYGIANILEKAESARNSAKRARSQYAAATKTIQTMQKERKEQRKASDQRHKLWQTSLATKEAELKQFKDRKAAMHSREIELTTMEAKLKTRAAKLKTRAAKLKTRAAELEIREAELKDLQTAVQRFDERQKGQTLCAPANTGTEYPDGDGEGTFEPDTSDKECSAPLTKNGKLDETPRSILKSFVCSDTGLLPLNDKYVTFDDSPVDTYAFIGVEAKELDGYQANATDVLNIEGAELSELNERQDGQGLVLQVEETRLEHLQTALQMGLDEQDRDHALCAATTTGIANAVMVELDEIWDFINQDAVNMDFMETGVDFPVNVEAW
jgi:flagellar biosynthesis GTPase FlhF